MKQLLAWSLLVLFLGACSSPDADHVNDMAREHADDAPESNPVSDASPAAPVESRMVDYAEVDGAAASGYFAAPEGADDSLPGIIVIHEWWGLNDNIRSMADQLAAQGYRALAVDLYGGESADTPEGAMALMSASMEKRDQLTENLRQAYAFLSPDGQKVGTIGWCFGGGWSLGTALALPQDIDATIIYYGRLETDPDVLAPLEMPVLGFFGALDGGIPVDSVREFESALSGLEKDVEIHVYEDADHAFANPSGRNYQEAPAKDSWERTVAFFEEHLKS